MTVFLSFVLQVGVHNGWCFIEKPQTFHLDARNIQTKSLKPGASPTFRRSQRFKNSRNILAEEGLVFNTIALNPFLHEYSCKAPTTLNDYINKMLLHRTKKLLVVGSNISYFQKQTE